MRVHKFFGFILVLALTQVSNGFADGDEDHGIGRIITKDLNLTYIDHVLTGRIANRPVVAKPLTTEFGIQLAHRAHHKAFNTVFKKRGNLLAGDVKSLSPTKKSIDTTLAITQVIPEKGYIRGQIADRQFAVTVTSDSVEGHHFVEPRFQIVFSSGQTYSFDIKGGKACMGCAVKLTYAIISMLYAAGIV